MHEPKPNALAEASFAPCPGSHAPTCKCGKKMRYSRRRALDIKGWICPDMVTDYIRLGWEAARTNHTKPITVQEDDQAHPTTAGGTGGA